MSKAPPSDGPDPSPAEGGGLQGFMRNEEWDELLAYVSGLVEEMQQISDPELRDRVFELLQGVDAIHREALTRLVRLFKEGVLEQVIQDPPIHALMALYDLLPPERGSEAGDSQPRFPDIPIKVEPMPPKGTAEEAPPHWLPVLDNIDQVPVNEGRRVASEEGDILICRLDEELYALEAHCLRDGSPFDEIRLQRYTLVCPHHEACYYDIRSGAKVGGGGALKAYLVQKDDAGRVLIGVNVPFKPNLPAF